MACTPWLMLIIGSVNENWSTQGTYFLFINYLLFCYFSASKCSIYLSLSCYLILMRANYYFNFNYFYLPSYIIFSNWFILSICLAYFFSSYFIFYSRLLFYDFLVYSVLTKSPILAFSSGHRSVSIILFRCVFVVFWR